MSDYLRKPKPAVEGSTRDLLIESAALEFNACGFYGTDTNRIARRAGFAPQTFYRHFDDKTDVFIAVYARWQESERRDIMRVLQADAKGRTRTLALAAALLESHRAWRVFRRSLRLLAVEDERVRSARAQSRRAQLEAIAGAPAHQLPWEARVAALLTVERLCDAAADEEIADLGIDAPAWRNHVVVAIDGLRSATGHS